MIYSRVDLYRPSSSHLQRQKLYTLELRYNEVHGVHGFDPRYIRGEGYNAGRPPPSAGSKPPPPLPVYCKVSF